MPPSCIIDEEYYPAIAWVMRHYPDGEHHRFLVAGEHYVVGYPKVTGKKGWVYTVLAGGSKGVAQDFAVAETARYEDNDWTLEGEPLFHAELVYATWMKAQHGMTTEPSKTMDSVFDTIFKYGAAA